MAVVEEVEELQDQGRDCGRDVQDALYVGSRRDRPHPSFNVLKDTFAGYFLVVRPVDDDPKPFWLTCVLTNPNLDPGHVNSIQLQY